MRYHWPVVTATPDAPKVVPTAAYILESDNLNLMAGPLTVVYPIKPVQDCVRAGQSGEADIKATNMITASSEYYRRLRSHLRGRWIEPERPCASTNRSCRNSGRAKCRLDVSNIGDQDSTFRPTTKYRCHFAITEIEWLLEFPAASKARAVSV
jgi:hypothetical protein